MSLPEAGAITAIWSNVPEEHDEAIRKWHNIEHSTERLEGPGYIVLRRYNREGGEGSHGRLTYFEGVDVETFNSPYYHQSRNNPTPWTRKSMGFIRDARRGVYGLERHLKSGCLQCPKLTLTSAIAVLSSSNLPGQTQIPIAQ